MSFNKYICITIIAFLFLTGGSASCQNIEDTINNESLSEFSKLFYYLPLDSTLKEQEIDLRDYPNNIIDTCFYSFANKIPFFYPYATFKIVKPKGILFCILHDCPAEMTDLRIVEFVSYDNDGRLKNRLMLPYYKSGWFSPNPEDYFRSTIYTSISEIVFIQTIYTKKDNYNDESIYKYKISEEAIPILVRSNNQ